MPHERFKSESYQLLGGINTKVSSYQTGPFEFLDLTNLDFQTPAALSQRWGSTMYVGQTFGAKITSLFEYAKITGESYVMIGHTGALWFGATTGQSQGVSFANQGATINIAVRWSNFVKSGNSIAISFPQIFYQGVYPTNASGGAPGNVSNYFISPLVNGSNNLDFITYTNYAFIADGQKFFKFNGTNTSNIGVIPAMAFGATYDMQDLASAGTFGIGCSTGYYAVYASLVNDRGLESEIWPIATIDTSGLNGVTLGNGSTFLRPWFNIETPLAYGISAINVYSYWASTTLYIGSTNMWGYPYKLINTFAASGSTQTTIYYGTSLGGVAAGFLTSNSGSAPASNEYSLLGFTLTFGATQTGNIRSFDISPFYPRYLEVYQNRLFSAGFSTMPSNVWFSDVGEPEGYFPENNFEVRTNDGDVITAIKAYSTRLYVFKQNSFHILYGDNPENFYVQEVSLEYGCINNRCAVVYDDILIFLDRKGVIKFNGSQIEVLSNKVQSFFDSMNFSAAITEACMVHDKLRNQIIISIPINGSTINNAVMVYDYLVGAWTRYNGPAISAFQSMQGRNNTKNAFFGSYTGIVSWYGSSFLTDNGTGFTLYAKSRFLKPMGDSTQEQHRKLYMNIEASSTTTSIELNFFQDYGTSIVLGRTMVITGFQNVMNFGICSRSLAFEMKTIQSSQLFRFYGFTLESRFQRRD